MSSKQGKSHTKPREQADKALSVRERHKLKKSLAEGDKSREGGE